MQKLDGPYNHERYLKVLEGLKVDLTNELAMPGLCYEMIGSNTAGFLEFRLLNPADPLDWVVISVIERTTGAWSYDSTGTALIRVWRRFGRTTTFREAKDGYSAKTYVKKALALLGGSLAASARTQAMMTREQKSKAKVANDLGTVAESLTVSPNDDGSYHIKFGEQDNLTVEEAIRINALFHDLSERKG